jgi:hypothetical protein
MKKILGIIVLGLLLQSCATPVGQDTSMQKEKNWVAKTHMSPKSGFKDALIGASWGLYTPHLYDFYAYGESKEEAEDIANNKCKNFRKEKNWETKAKCNRVTSYLTEKGNSLALDDEKKKQAKAVQAKASENISFTINDKKKQCKAIGFAPATEKFADCVLRLVELDVNTQQANQIALAQSLGNQQVATELQKQRNDQSSQAFIDLGLQLLSPQSTVSAPSTSTCNVRGSGAYKTINCW